ncbi:MAG: diacylglycerol kinase family protein [Candidatus Hydrogenedentota bacterium]
MHILIVASDDKRLRAAGVKEFRRRVEHAGWMEETITLREFLAHPPPLHNYDDLAIAGGDGTVNACLTQSGRLPIVVVPVGTGNDLARSLSIRTEGDAGRSLRSGHRIKLDIGSVTTDKGEERFVNGIGIGLDGMVASLHHRGIPYELAALSSLVRVPRFRARLSIDGGRFEEIEFMSLLVANGAWFGGGFKMAPNALLNDGVFDLISIAPVTRRKFLESFQKAKAGKHLQEDAVTERRGRSFILESDEPLPWHLDGESRSSKRLDVKVLPKEKAFYTLI